MWFARILLVGILAFAVIYLLSTAIIFAAPFISAIIVLCAGGSILYYKLDRDDPEE